MLSCGDGAKLPPPKYMYPKSTVAHSIFGLNIRQTNAH